MARRKTPLPKGPSPAQQERERKRKDDLNRRIDEFLDWTRDHPSVWDTRQ